MNTLTDHIVPGDIPQNQLSITVMDEPGQGGACHQYLIEARNERTSMANSWRIDFQNGPIKEYGLNGVTQEALLAIVIDRLRSFQAGPFSSADNADALRYCVYALKHLQKRTVDRIARGVEGTNQA